MKRIKIVSNRVDHLRKNDLKKKRIKKLLKNKNKN